MPEKPGYIRLEEAPPKIEAPRKPWLLRTYTITPFLMRQVFKRVELYEKSGEVPVILFRRSLRRLLDMFDPELTFDTEAFGSRKGGLKMTWADVRAAIDKGSTPEIPLDLMQSIFLVFEDFTSSWLGLIWYVITNVAIILNIVVIVMSSLKPSEEDAVKLNLVMEVSVYLFIFDYMAKAISVLWCPIALIDEAYLLNHVVPDDKLVADSLHTKTRQRFFHWASSASNVIDFLSILPAVMSLLFTSMHLPLSALRMLRLLRVIRVLRAFKAVGKWVVTLQVLGEAFYDSIGSILVLILYIGLFSMVAGAVLYQQEGGALDEYSDVPEAIVVVAEKFIGKSISVSTSIISAFVLAGVGMFKGIIFLLPIDKMKKASKAAEKRFDTLSEMRSQVDVEDMHKAHPIEAWATDLRCPAVRLRVFQEGTISAERAAGGQGVPSTGMLNVPIMKTEPVEAMVCVPLHGGPASRRFGSRPELEVHVQWKPSGMTDQSLPRGELTIKIKSGKFFYGGEKHHWCVHMEAPEKLYGQAASADWVSPASKVGSPSPEWPDAAVHTFKIQWEVPADAHAKSENADQVFQRRVLEMLEEQTKKIASLEAQVLDLKSLKTN